MRATMDHLKLLHQARRRILADADEAREVMYSELNRVLHSAFQEKLLAINAASKLIALSNPHFDPTETLEKYLINLTTDHSISPAVYVHLVEFFSKQKQPLVKGPCHCGAHSDGRSDSPLDLSCSSSVFSSPPQTYSPPAMTVQLFSNGSLVQQPFEQEDKKYDFHQNSLPLQQPTSSLPPQKRKFSMTHLDTSLSITNQIEVFESAQFKEVLQDESVNNFAKENRKENLLTLQRKCQIDSCNLYFGNKKTMHAHMAEVHNVLKFSCQISNCGSSYCAQQQLSAHLLTVHSSLNTFDCPKCVGKTFKKYELMSHHIYSEHSLGLFQCAVEGCAFQANIRSQVSRHFEKSHRKYCCTYCNRSFTYTGHLRTHERTHLRVKPFSCTWPKCHYLSENKSHLISHIRIRHFNLPPTKKLQMALNIEDDRNPMDFMAIDYELIERTKNLFKKKGLNFVDSC